MTRKHFGSLYVLIDILKNKKNYSRRFLSRDEFNKAVEETQKVLKSEEPNEYYPLGFVCKCDYVESNLKFYSDDESNLNKLYERVKEFFLNEDLELFYLNFKSSNREIDVPLKDMLILFDISLDKEQKVREEILGKHKSFYTDLENRVLKIINEYFSKKRQEDLERLKREQEVEQKRIEEEKREKQEIQKLKKADDYDLVLFFVENKIERKKIFREIKRRAKKVEINENKYTINSRGYEQVIFKETLLVIYERKCSVCGLSILELLDAAHIIPWVECNDEQKSDPQNGILLCANHHRLFDAKQLIINEKFEISYPLVNCEKTHADEYFAVNKKLILPQKEHLYPNKEYIKKHYNSDL